MIEDVLLQAVKVNASNAADYENGWLALWARDAADRLTKEEHE